MLKKYLKISALMFALISSSSFASAVNFDGSTLTGNFTRTNFEKFKFFSIQVKEDCSIPALVVTTKIRGEANLELDVNNSVSGIPTELFLEIVDENSNDKVGKFVEFRNSSRVPAPKCAKNVKFSFSN